MNVFANGNSQQAEALVLALALPGMLTTWMLNQPTILGQAPADHNPVAVIGDIGQTTLGQSIAVDAKASFDPNGKALTYDWSFGDGATASGVSVSHAYTVAGSYTLTLTVTASGGGKRSISKVINVVTQPVNYANPYAGEPQDGKPRSNLAVTLPSLNGQQTGTLTTPPTAPTGVPQPGTTSSSFPLGAAVFVLVAILIVGVLIVTARRRRRI